jgi:RNA recognition motif-containing protein
MDEADSPWMQGESSSEEQETGAPPMERRSEQDRRIIVNKKLYVGNLSYSVSSADLEQMFGQFGEVQSAKVIEDRDTGRSKGFGFVEMRTDQAAKAAIAGLHGQEREGRALTVNEAQPRENRGGGFGGGRGRY